MNTQWIVLIRGTFYRPLSTFLFNHLKLSSHLINIVCLISTLNINTMKKQKTVLEWLETIADPKIREAAISQTWEEKKHYIVDSLAKAIWHFNSWDETKGGRAYWESVWMDAANGDLETREVPNDETKVFTFPESEYTKTEKDGVITLTPRKKKLFIEVYLNGIGKVCSSRPYQSLEELEEYKAGSEEYPNTTHLGIVEFEYEPKNVGE